ncbi:IS5 family transposase [Puniceicoccus vermicola]
MLQRDVVLSLFIRDNIQVGRNASRSSRGAKKINNLYRTEVGSHRGRPVGNLDATLNGIWWILCTGSIWNQLPERYGKWNSVWRCFRRWCGSGMWGWILQNLTEQHSDYEIALMLDGSHIKAHQDASRSPLDSEQQKLGKTKGGRNTKLSAVVNLAGRAVSLVLVPGNEHDSVSAIETLPKNLKAKFVLADKAYDANRIRSHIESAGGFCVIPPKANRKETISYDKEIGRLRRIVENFFCRIKSYRRVATRYEQLPQTFLGFVTLSAIVDWIKFEFVHAA